MTPIEAAAKAVCDFQEYPCLKNCCGVCKEKARADVLAYLKALVEQGPSQVMIDAGLEAEPWTPEEIWPSMLRAHIAELESSK